MYLKISNILSVDSNVVDYFGLDIDYFGNPIYFLEEKFVVVKYNAETFENNANIFEITEQEYNDYKAKKENEIPIPPPSDVLTPEQRIDQLEKEKEELMQKYESQKKATELLNLTMLDLVDAVYSK